MATVKYFFSGICFIFSSIGLAKLSFSWYKHQGLSSISSVLLYLITGHIALLGLLSGSVLLFISSQRASGHHSVFSALQFFIIKYHRLYVGGRRLKKFRSACKAPRQAQEILLREIMKANQDTEYGRQFQLSQIHSLEDFRKRHPITEYDHYKPFVDRVSKGDRNVMTTNKVSRLIRSSGTTGASKYIPRDEYASDNGLILQEAFQQEIFLDLQPMQPKLKVHINSEVKRSAGGITIAAGTALEEHMIKQYAIYTPPCEGQLIGTLYEAFYVDLLFALREKHIGAIWIPFSGTLMDLIKFLEDNWVRLVDDLSRGTICSDLKLNQRIRTALLRRIGSGAPDRAREVKQMCEKGFQGIIKRLWPNCKFIACIDSIGIRNYLKKNFSDGIEIYSSLYVCSEGFLGLNLWPFKDGKAEYALNLTENIYEFIKIEDSDNENPTTYFADEVEVGQKYELLLSQKYGLYRFRFGDVVEVTGFYQSSPKISFLYRKATILNLAGEKLDQQVVRDSLNAVLSPWKDQVKLKHYSCVECALDPEQSESRRSGLYYVFFLELKSEIGDKLPVGINSETMAKDIQKNLCERHSFYSVFVNTKQITTPKVYITKEGAFLILKEYILANTMASRTQFKMPIKLRTKEMVDVLLQNILPV